MIMRGSGTRGFGREKWASQLHYYIPLLCIINKAVKMKKWSLNYSSGRIVQEPNLDVVESIISRRLSEAS